METPVKQMKVEEKDQNYGELLFAQEIEPTPEKCKSLREQAKKALEVKLQGVLEGSADLEPKAKERIAGQFKEFRALFGNFLDGGSSKIEWNKIKDLPSESIIEHDSLECKYETDHLKAELDKLVIVKLNGGLGTSMGCQGPKSLIPVRGDLTFLDLTVAQVRALNMAYDVNIPLVLMNSFNTKKDMQKEVLKYKGNGVSIYMFEQSCFPRVSQSTLMPLATNCSAEKKEWWYPPGHGDFYRSFKRSGLLDQFLRDGKTCCFVSNIDNLGARVDFPILHLMSEKPFVMEVTQKTLADVKGGTLIYYGDGMRLLEVAQVPEHHLKDFENISTFKVFNTNNVWMKLDAISKLLKEDKIEMEVIVNPKTLEKEGQVYQLETAIGAAMKYFENAVGIKVPRTRFLPVKKTSDLLMLMSDLYTESEGTLRQKQEGRPPPVVKLDDRFRKVSDFKKRIASIPSLADVEKLIVTGDVTFGKGVVLAGKVIIVAEPNERLHIPDGCVIKNKMIQGSLKITES